MPTLVVADIVAYIQKGVNTSLSKLLYLPSTVLLLVLQVAYHAFIKPLRCTCHCTAAAACTIRQSAYNAYGGRQQRVRQSAYTDPSFTNK
ncbi:MAG: hypothetical protein HG458_006835 [Prevotella sp.]|nr:hypothetical protein [Prevotella sp.]